MNSCIYKITNLDNNNFYIGSTNNFNKRKVNHLYLLKTNKHPNIFLQNSWNKHNGNFKIEIVEKCLTDILLKKEQYYIDYLKPKYNISKIAGRTTGIICKEETKLKISKANTGKIRSAETIKKLKDSWNGKYNNSKKVYLLDSNNRLINSWNSCGDASREFGLNRLTFSKLARLSKLITSNKSKLKGYIITYNKTLIDNTKE